MGGAQSWLAPEVAEAGPGRGVVLDFSRCDEYGAGRVLQALTDHKRRLEAGGAVPLVGGSVIEGLLKREPSERLAASAALAMLRAAAPESVLWWRGARAE